MKHQDPSILNMSSDSIQAMATAKTSNGSAGESQEDDSEEPDYDFVGDITWVCGSNFLFLHLCSTFIGKLIPADADPWHLAWVHGSGTVNKSDEKNFFDLDPAQYTSALKEFKATNPAVSVLPLHCVIPDSHRYKDGKKPIPHVGTMVSFEGYLFSRMTSETWKTERFHIDIDRVNFMGRSSVPPPTPDIGPYIHTFSAA